MFALNPRSFIVLLLHHISHFDRSYSCSLCHIFCFFFNSIFSNGCLQTLHIFCDIFLCFVNVSLLLSSFFSFSFRKQRQEKSNNHSHKIYHIRTFTSYEREIRQSVECRYYKVISIVLSLCVKNSHGNFNLQCSNFVCCMVRFQLSVSW